MPQPTLGTSIITSLRVHVVLEITNDIFLSQLLYSGTSIKQLGQGTGKICSLYYEDYEVSLYRGCFPYILLSYWGKQYRSLLQRTTLSRGSLYRRFTVKYMEKNLSITKLDFASPFGPASLYRGSPLY